MRKINISGGGGGGGGRLFDTREYSEVCMKNNKISQSPLFLHSLQYY